jgi:hypothetical protein
MYNPNDPLGMFAMQQQQYGGGLPGMSSQQFGVAMPDPMYRSQPFDPMTATTLPDGVYNDDALQPKNGREWLYGLMLAQLATANSPAWNPQQFGMMALQQRRADQMHNQRLNALLKPQLMKVGDRLVEVSPSYKRVNGRLVKNDDVQVKEVYSPPQQPQMTALGENSALFSYDPNNPAGGQIVAQGPGYGVNEGNNLGVKDIANMANTLTDNWRVEMSQHKGPVGAFNRTLAGSEIYYTVDPETKQFYGDQSPDYFDTNPRAKQVKSDLAVADFQTVYALNKMLDDQSVVRESETAQTMQTRSKLEEVSALMRKTLNGELLTPEQRKSMNKLMHRIAQESDSAARSVTDRYTQLGSQYGMSPQQVGIDYQGLQVPEAYTQWLYPDDGTLQTIIDEVTQDDPTR